MAESQQGEIVENPKQWMPLHIEPLLRKTKRLRHGDLKWAYLLLLMHYWVNGPLADDDDELSAIAEVSYEDWVARFGPKLRPYFTLGDDGLLHQERADAEIKKATLKSAARRLAGKEGAEARWHGKRMANASARDAHVQVQKKEERLPPSEEAPLPAEPIAVAPKPPATSLFPDLPPKPKTAYEVMRDEAFPILGDLLSKPLDDPKERRAIGKVLNDLWVDADKNIEVILAALRASLALPEPPDSPIPWLKTQIRQATAKPRLVVNNDPNDAWGIQAWCSTLQGIAPTQSETERASGKWIWNGMIIDAYAEAVAKAAMLPKSWRGSWAALGGWALDGIPLRDVRPIIASRTERESYDPSQIQSIAFFDGAVRGGKRAA